MVGGAVVAGAGGAATVSISMAVIIAVTTATGTVLLGLAAFMTVRFVRRKRGLRTQRNDRRRNGPATIGTMSFARCLPNSQGWFDTLRSNPLSIVSSGDSDNSNDSTLSSVVNT